MGRVEVARIDLIIKDLEKCPLHWEDTFFSYIRDYPYHPFNPWPVSILPGLVGYALPVGHRWPWGGRGRTTPAPAFPGSGVLIGYALPVGWAGAGLGGFGKGYHRRWGFFILRRAGFCVALIRHFWQISLQGAILPKSMTSPDEKA